MMIITKRGTRAVSACIVVGAVALGSAAQATDWDALSGADWGVKRTGDVEKVAQASGAGGDSGAAIQKAFVDLGMAEARAECYGKVLAENLSPEGQQEAVQLVSEASSADEIKTGVLSGGPELVGGFSAADASCPESMGG